MRVAPRSLALAGHPTVFACGDAVAQAATLAPKTAIAAEIQVREVRVWHESLGPPLTRPPHTHTNDTLEQAAHVAAAIRALLAGAPAPAFAAAPFTQLGLALGRSHALLFMRGWLLPEAIPLRVIAQDYVTASIRKRCTGSSTF